MPLNSTIRFVYKNDRFFHFIIMIMKRRTTSIALKGKDIYDGEFSRRAPIFKKAAQHLESMFGLLIYVVVSGLLI